MDVNFRGASMFNRSGNIEFDGGMDVQGDSWQPRHILA
jgi:hypothetical protein